MLVLGLIHHHTHVIQEPTHPAKVPSHALIAVLVPTHLLPPPKYAIRAHLEDFKKPPKLPLVFLLILDTIEWGQQHKYSVQLGKLVWAWWKPVTTASLDNFKISQAKPSA